MSITDKLDKLVEIYQQAKLFENINFKDHGKDGFNTCMIFTKLGVQLLNCADIAAKAVGALLIVDEPDEETGTIQRHFTYKGVRFFDFMRSVNNEQQN